MTINCPLHESTRGLFDEKLLRSMKKAGHCILHQPLCHSLYSTLKKANQNISRILDANTLLIQVLSPSINIVVQILCLESISSHQTQITISDPAMYCGGLLSSHSVCKRPCLAHTILQCRLQGAYLVNTARGAIVDRDSLVKVINDGHLAGYAGDGTLISNSLFFCTPAPFL